MDKVTKTAYNHNEKMKQVYINTFMCLHCDCPCLGGVCVNPKEPVLEIFCPKQSGCLDEVISNRLKECNICDEKYETKMERVLANPNAYPRMYSGDGKHYTPMFPEWKMEMLLAIYPL
jgi:transcription elongation factor Elf1